MFLWIEHVIRYCDINNENLKHSQSMILLYQAGLCLKSTSELLGRAYCWSSKTYEDYPKCRQQSKWVTFTFNTSVHYLFTCKIKTWQLGLRKGLLANLSLKARVSRREQRRPIQDPLTQLLRSFWYQIGGTIDDLSRRFHHPLEKLEGDFTMILLMSLVLDIIMDLCITRG